MRQILLATLRPLSVNDHEGIICVVIEARLQICLLQKGQGRTSRVCPDAARYPLLLDALYGTARHVPEPVAGPSDERPIVRKSEYVNNGGHLEC